MAYAKIACDKHRKMKGESEGKVLQKKIRPQERSQSLVAWVWRFCFVNAQTKLTRSADLAAGNGRN